MFLWSIILLLSVFFKTDHPIYLLDLFPVFSLHFMNIYHIAAVCRRINGEIAKWYKRAVRFCNRLFLIFLRLQNRFVSSFGSYKRDIGTINWPLQFGSSKLWITCTNKYERQRIFIDVTISFLLLLLLLIWIFVAGMYVVGNRSLLSTFWKRKLMRTYRVYICVCQVSHSFNICLLGFLSVLLY